MGLRLQVKIKFQTEAHFYTIYIIPERTGWCAVIAEYTISGVSDMSGGKQ